MDHARVLLVDDDVELVEILREYLHGEGFATGAVHDGESAIGEALSGRYAIVVLDMMMPGLSGMDVLQRIRSQSQLPVLMLTAKGDNTARIAGLEAGADDYVPKPCTARELVARLRAILRRTQPTEASGEPQTYSAGALCMWPAQRRAQWAEQLLDLTSTEYNLLEILLRNAGRTVGRNELSEQGLGRPLERYDRSIDVHLTNIRRKLAQYPGGRDCIKTVFRRGYQLVME